VDNENDRAKYGVSSLSAGGEGPREGFSPG
jgi:hypothetical protein